MSAAPEGDGPILGETGPKADGNAGNSSKADATGKRFPRQAKWALRNPLATWAHSATRSAIRRGLLTRQSCQECGADRTDAHHPDHRDPLSVVWLCRRCHKETHAKARKAGAA